MTKKTTKNPTLIVVGILLFAAALALLLVPIVNLGWAGSHSALTLILEGYPEEAVGIIAAAAALALAATIATVKGIKGKRAAVDTAVATPASLD